MFYGVILYHLQIPFLYYCIFVPNTVEDMWGWGHLFDHKLVSEKLLFILFKKLYFDNRLLEIAKSYENDEEEDDEDELDEDYEEGEM